jgi:hypothetical protein
MSRIKGPGDYPAPELPDATDEDSGMVCLVCGSRHISFRPGRSPEDGRYVCDDCGSDEVE